MNEADFIRMETELGIILPTEYRPVMTTLANELRQLTLEFRGSCDDECLVYLDADRVLLNNLSERGDSGLSERADSGPIPDWAQTYFLIGDNTGGDFFCLRLDKTPGVWVIGSDCEEGQVAETFEQYVQTRLNDARDEMGDPALALAVPCLTERDWLPLHSHFPQAEILGSSYGDFESVFQREFHQHRRDDREPRRIWLTAQAIQNWCEEHTCLLDAQSLHACAVYQLETQEPWLRKYRLSQQS